jgi:transposase
MGQIRRRFSAEFKRGLVLRIETGELRVSEATREYQVAPEIINRWRRQYARNELFDRGSSRERELKKENQRLKEKIGELVLEIDHLKRLQDWMAQNRNVDTAVITGENWEQYRKDGK